MLVYLVGLVGGDGCVCGVVMIGKWWRRAGRVRLERGRGVVTVGVC